MMNLLDHIQLISQSHSQILPPKKWVKNYGGAAFRLDDVVSSHFRFVRLLFFACEFSGFASSRTMAASSDAKGNDVAVRGKQEGERHEITESR
jgi:hypothetical protein